MQHNAAEYNIVIEDLKKTILALRDELENLKRSNLAEIQKIKVSYNQQAEELTSTIKALRKKVEVPK